MFIDRNEFQYLGSRGAQLELARTPTLFRWFQYLGSRGAQLRQCFKNTANHKVSILGLARSPTPARRCGVRRPAGFNTWAREEPNVPLIEAVLPLERFNTWAREEPNISLSTTVSCRMRFQYLGSRGAQLVLFAALLAYLTSFNTWAREEPNDSIFSPSVCRISCFNTWAREEPNFISSSTRR